MNSSFPATRKTQGKRIFPVSLSYKPPRFIVTMQIPGGPGSTVESTLKGALSMVLLLKAALVILRLKQVEQRSGLKRSSIYQKISENDFPEQVKLGARAVGWIESEIDAWIVAQVEKSRNVPFAAPMIPETKPGSAEVQPTLRNGIRTEELIRPPKTGSPSSFPGTGPPILPPSASSNKGGRGDV